MRRALATVAQQQLVLPRVDLRRVIKPHATELDIQDAAEAVRQHSRSVGAFAVDPADAGVCLLDRIALILFFWCDPDISSARAATLRAHTRLPCAAGQHQTEVCFLFSFHELKSNISLFGSIPL